MKLSFWPETKKHFNRYIGKCTVKTLPAIIHCPKCGENLIFCRTEGFVYKGFFCFVCGRDLRKSITGWEKFKHWFGWFGDRRLMGKWPIGYIDIKLKTNKQK